MMRRRPITPSLLEFVPPPSPSLTDRWNEWTRYPSMRGFALESLLAIAISVVSFPLVYFVALPMVTS
jgi:hypothetical protein